MVTPATAICLRSGRCAISAVLAGAAARAPQPNRAARGLPWTASLLRRLRVVLGTRTPEYARTAAGLIGGGRAVHYRELSLRLVQMEAVALTEESAIEFARLRVKAETAPFETLPDMALQALYLIRGLCRDSLARGDLQALTSQATMAAELREFAVSARLLAEG
jgi:hypothetical protein